MVFIGAPKVQPVASVADSAYAVVVVRVSASLVGVGSADRDAPVVVAVTRCRTPPAGWPISAPVS